MLKWGWNTSYLVDHEEEDFGDDSRPPVESAVSVALNEKGRTTGGQGTKAERKEHKKALQKSQGTKGHSNEPAVMIHQVDDIQYQQKSVVANRKTQYPCPSGVYLTRVVRRMGELQSQQWVSSPKKSEEEEDETTSNTNAGSSLLLSLI